MGFVFTWKLEAWFQVGGGWFTELWFTLPCWFELPSVSLGEHGSWKKLKLWLKEVLMGLAASSETWSSFRDWLLPTCSGGCCTDVTSFTFLQILKLCLPSCFPHSLWYKGQRFHLITFWFSAGSQLGHLVPHSYLEFVLFFCFFLSPFLLNVSTVRS